MSHSVEHAHGMRLVAPLFIGVLGMLTLGMLRALVEGMKHTIEYDGERKTVEAKRTASVNDVLEIAWPGLTWRQDFSYGKVVCVGSGKSAEKAVRS